MYSKEKTKADVKNVPGVLTANPHLLHADHAKHGVLASKMHKAEKQAQTEKFQTKYTHSSKTSSSDKNLFHCFLHCIFFS